MKEQWKAMDLVSENEMIPLCYQFKRLIILCNDCEEKSDITFSFYYRKCNSCGSYNTSEIEQYSLK